MTKKRLCLLGDDAADKRERFITVTGSMSATFHEALDAALDNDAPAEQQKEIAKIVALESAAQDVEIITGLADKYSNGYMLKNVESLNDAVGADEIVVDVHDTAEPNDIQMVNGVGIIQMIEKGKIRPDQYVPVFVYPSQDATKERSAMVGFESICKKAGVKVCRIVKKKK